MKNLRIFGPAVLLVFVGILQMVQAYKQTLDSAQITNIAWIEISYFIVLYFSFAYYLITSPRGKEYATPLLIIYVFAFLPIIETLGDFRPSFLNLLRWISILAMWAIWFLYMLRVRARSQQITTGILKSIVLMVYVGAYSMIGQEFMFQYAEILGPLYGLSGSTFLVLHMYELKTWEPPKHDELLDQIGKV